MESMTLGQMKEVKGIGQWRFLYDLPEPGKPVRRIPAFLLPRTPKVRLVSYICGSPVHLTFTGRDTEENLTRHIKEFRLEVIKTINQRCQCLQMKKQIKNSTDLIRVFKLYDDDAEVCIGFFRKENGFFMFHKK